MANEIIIFECSAQPIFYEQKNGDLACATARDEKDNRMVGIAGKVDPRVSQQVIHCPVTECKYNLGTNQNALARQHLTQL